MPALSRPEPRANSSALPHRERKARATGPRAGLGLAPKIALVAVLITFLGLTAVTILGYALITAASRDEAGQQLEGRANNVARLIDARVAAALQDLQALTWSRDIQQAVGRQPSAVDGENLALTLGRQPAAGSRRPRAHLERLLTAQLWELLVTDMHGRTAASSEPGEAPAHRNENWWKAAFQGGIYVGDELEWDRSDALWVLPLAVAIRDPGTGEPTGVLRARYNWKIIRDDVLQMERSSPTAYVLVIDGQGHLLAAPGDFDPGHPMGQAP